MWTIAGGILLALLLLAAIPILLQLAPLLIALAIVAVVVVGGGNLLIHEPGLAASLFILAAVCIAISLVLAGYKESRNIRLFLRGLILRSSPAFSLRARAEKELALETHERAVQRCLTKEKDRLVDRDAAKIRRISERVWRKYARYGELITTTESGGSLTFSTSETGRLFTVRIDLDYPQKTLPKYQFQGHQEYAGSEHDFLYGLKRPMRKQMRMAVLAIERDNARAHVSRGH